MAHKMEVLARNMELGDRVREYVEKKAQRLDRHLPQIEETRVELTHVKSVRSSLDRYTAQITVRVKKTILRTEERSDDVRAAFDAALEKMDRQIERYKGKHYHSRGDGRSAAEVTGLPAVEEADTEPAALVVRRKKFVLLPMDEAEAIEQMKLLGHENFFIFYNADANKVCVLYRRRDGSYGLIEPEIG